MKATKKIKRKLRADNDNACDFSNDASFQLPTNLAVADELVGLSPDRPFPGHCQRQNVLAECSENPLTVAASNQGLLVGCGFGRRQV